MSDETPHEPDRHQPPDHRPRQGPNGELVSEDGHYYWTGSQWLPLDRPFPTLAEARPVQYTSTPDYDKWIVAGVAVVSSIVLGVVVSTVVYLYPSAIVIPVLLVAAAGIFLWRAKKHGARVRSVAYGLLIGAGVALIISPGAACFGVFLGSL
jgi:hypothetical protein